MKSENYVKLIGNAGKDAVVKNTATGGKLVLISLATTKSWQDKKTGEWQKQTEWHNLQFWNNDEAAMCVKGDTIEVEGEIQYRSYEKEGQTKYVTNINCKSYTNHSRTSEIRQGNMIKDYEVTTNNDYTTNEIPF